MDSFFDIIVEPLPPSAGTIETEMVSLSLKAAPTDPDNLNPGAVIDGVATAIAEAMGGKGQLHRGHITVLK
ncbi:MAG: hypothetical protein QGG34_04270 [SAR202 cluster bacterium]|nr:hypothetical protein [SAR202 cluster bacterium]MDP7224240.1 hypothetical protein [SAR202 cluster bacterium]MDP7533978.1 hypothetical protein [SAR202 cluster bacterium]